MALAISYGDIEAAHRRLQGVAHRTPVMRSKTVDDLTGAQVFFKCENFQRMGARLRRRIDNFKRPLKRLVVIARHLGDHQRGTPRPNT